MKYENCISWINDSHSLKIVNNCLTYKSKDFYGLNILLKNKWFIKLKMELIIISNNPKITNMQDASLIT